MKVCWHFLWPFVKRAWSKVHTRPWWELCPLHYCLSVQESEVIKSWSDWGLRVPNLQWYCAPWWCLVKLYFSPSSGEWLTYMLDPAFLWFAWAKSYCKQPWFRRWNHQATKLAFIWCTRWKGWRTYITPKPMDTETVTFFSKDICILDTTKIGYNA